MEINFGGVSKCPRGIRDKTDGGGGGGGLGGVTPIGTVSTAVHCVQ